MGSTIDLVGNRYGLWTVKSFAENRRSIVYWNCVCDCGTEKAVRGGGLKAGVSLSCGCVRKQKLGEFKSTHGHARHPAYRSWQMMKNRCLNDKFDGFDGYGGRGIKVHPSWMTFEGFWADMGKDWFKGSSIEREDVDGNYEPGNCCWATPKQQGNNRRTNHKIMTPKGAMNVTEAAEKFGISPFTIFARIRYGWPEADLLLPVRKRPK
jgi:hypothetical protein